MDKITIQIKCSSETCEELREQGLFFETIANALNVDRKDIKEIIKSKKYGKNKK